MHISFDLDGLLVPHYPGEFPVEPRGRLARWRGVEPIRAGAPALWRVLRKRNHTLSIYTTSYRSTRGVRRTLRYYGIRVERIVTGRESEATLRRLGVSASKYPPAFGFDVHVDDAAGVRLEGERLGFETIVVTPAEALAEKLLGHLTTLEGLT